MAIAEEAVQPQTMELRLNAPGVAARVVVAALVLAVVLLVPLATDEVWDRRISLAAIFGIIGLSVNVITGHAGQVSLGHQAFVGIGAFVSAFIATRLGAEAFAPAIPSANFFMALAISSVTGAVMALLLGLVALRIRGLYLALITLAFGLMAETTIFNWEPFTGGGAGANSPRPAAFVSEQAYAYLCLAFVGLFLLIDWRLVKTKAGRAIVALRNDERVAASLGINVMGYKLLAFVVAGTMAGTAGALFAHRQTLVQAADFALQTALVWVIMAVVGGLGSRAGVIIASAFFAIFPSLLPPTSITLPFFGEVIVQILSPLLGALLLVLTLTLYPGGIGQQILPFRRWLAGGALVESHHEATRLAGFPALLGLVLGLLLTVGRLGWLFGLVVGVAAAVALAVGSTMLLNLYLARYHRAARRGAGRPRPEPQAAEPTGPNPESVAARPGGSPAVATQEPTEVIEGTPRVARGSRLRWRRR